jgi:hypothetical protein
VALSVGYGVTASNVVILTVSDVSSRRALLAGNVGDSPHRQLGTAAVHVSYSVNFNAVASFASVASASSAASAALTSAIMSGNFSSNLLAASTANNLNEVYWVAPTDQSAFSVLIVTNSPTPLPTMKPSSKPNSSSSSSKADNSLAIGLGVGLGSVAFVVIILIAYKRCLGQSQHSVGVARDVNLIPGSPVPSATVARVGPMNGVQMT